ncbi:hypothetical protein [Streptomyces sp. NBC_00623]|uniref:hypothetical protein n=1 Tax=Streptomyces sp. NBC_00623 TaxID=2975790 RepID=UPI0030E0EC6B
MPPRPATKAATAPVSAVLGVDISARSTKAAVVDATTGRLLAVGRASHTVTGRYGARESDRATRLPRPSRRGAPAGARRRLSAAPWDTATWHGVTSDHDRATPSLLNTHS